MIVNAYTTRLPVIPGSRILETTLGLIGVQIPDSVHPQRVWRIHGLYAPLPGRALGGVRAKLVDNRSFTTFCNQRDLEVLLNLARPGQYCGWGECEYVAPDDNEWFGLCADDDDLLDDLFERELLLRSEMPDGILRPEFNIERRVHLSKNQDVNDVFVLLQDMDPETGTFPDPRFETLERRWVRAERTRTRWERS